MNRLAAVCLATCVAGAACDSDPARALKITPQPAQSTTPAAAPKPETTAASVEPARPALDVTHPAAPQAVATPATPQRPTTVEAGAWRPEGCPPPPMNAAGPDVLTVEGPCAFEHRAPAACEALADDFLITMTRPGAMGSTVMIYINVEKYKGPGQYDGAQMFVGVQDKVNIHRWSSDEVTITVGGGEASAVIARTTLTAEPLLVRCSGPMTNYQCDGRETSTPIDKTVEIVSGTLRCDKLVSGRPVTRR